jgi:hypothetical protein
VQQLPNEPGGPEYLEVGKAAHWLGSRAKWQRQSCSSPRMKPPSSPARYCPLTADFWRSRRARQTCWLFVRLSVVEQGHDLNDKSVADRQETRYSRDSSEYVRSKTPHAKKHSSGNQHNPRSERDQATSARSPILLTGGRLHRRQDIPATRAAAMGIGRPLEAGVKVDLTSAYRQGILDE